LEGFKEVINFMRILSEAKEKAKKFSPPFLISWYHFLLAFFGALIYRFPSKNLRVIGVTGTKGKSTVVLMAEKILEEAGFKVASLSSIKFKIREKEWENKLKMTMPGHFIIQKFLRDAVRAGCEYAILEVTSEGILQHRHRFIDFDTAVFTNLSPEHIEHHGSFESYRKAKGKLFEICRKTHAVNLDDENAKYFLGFPSSEKYGFRIKNQESGIRNQELTKDLKIIEAQNVQVKDDYLSFLIHNSLFLIHLLGKFNIYNVLSAICIGFSQGVDLEICKRALEKIEKIPGRMEIVVEGPFKVIVDYAHTPQSLIEVYRTVQGVRLKDQGARLICVLGAAGGGRDKWKRPEMGRIAVKYCDEIILTDEDPYDENPKAILEDIEKGILGYKFQVTSYKKILDRKEAIREALGIAKEGDTVIITGKGCEPWMCVEDGKKIPWDDREIVREEMKLPTAASSGVSK